MTQHRSEHRPPPRAGRRSSGRLLVIALLSTSMVATGGFGAFPDNPFTSAFQGVIGQNFPEQLLKSINSYFENLSVPTIQPGSDTDPKPSLDLIGLLFVSSPTVSPTNSEAPATASTTLTPTHTITSTTTSTITSTNTLTFTPSPTATSTARATLTLTATYTVTPAPVPTATDTPTSTPDPLSGGFRAGEVHVH